MNQQSNMPKFIQKVDIRKTNSQVSAEIDIANESDITFWVTNIQPEIQNEGRPDANWKWNILHSTTHPLKSIIGYSSQIPRLFAIRATTSNGNKFPVALLYMVEKYDSVWQQNKQTPFIVYLARATNTFLEKQFNGLLDLLLPIIDTAIIHSLLIGKDGEICLHSDPAGGEHLAKRYADVGLKKIAANEAKLKSGRRALALVNYVRRRLDNYFYADSEVVEYIISKANNLRHPLITEAA